jgi:hypothetical protein
MRADGELTADADPQLLATAVMAALQGGLLLSQATHGVQPLELALDMALEHVRRYRPADLQGDQTEPPFTRHKRQLQRPTTAGA